MELLGHSQISVTMNTYGHVLPDTQRDAAAKLDAMLGGSSTASKGQSEGGSESGQEDQEEGPGEQMEGEAEEGSDEEPEP
jgi:hypothetical protein